MIVRLFTRLSRIHRDDLCFTCGYATRLGRCPECGTLLAERSSLRARYRERRAVLLVILASLVWPIALAFVVAAPLIGRPFGQWMYRFHTSIIGTALVILLSLATLGLTPLGLSSAFYFHPQRGDTFRQAFNRAVNRTPARVILLMCFFFIMVTALVSAMYAGQHFSDASTRPIEWFPPLILSRLADMS